MFNVKYNIIQPYSGSIDNLAIYTSLLKYGGTIVSIHFDVGGLSMHGYKSSISVKNYNVVVFYGLAKNGFIDLKEV